MLFRNGTVCCAALTVENRSATGMNRASHLCFSRRRDSISRPPDKGNKKGQRKPQSIAPLQVFGVAGVAQPTKVQQLRNFRPFWYILGLQKSSNPEERP